MKTDLSQYNNEWYKPGSAIKRVFWFWIQAIFFHSKLFPFSSLFVFWLRLFGAKIGKGVNIKPGVNIKYPWNLEIAEYSWIGENVWIDNLDKVKIGAHVCISQGAMLECGNHNYTKATFDLIVEPISIEDGVWIGAKSFVGPGTYCDSHAVLSANSRAPKKLEAYFIYTGCPAVKVKERVIS